jgi:hypothetical protein
LAENNCVFETNVPGRGKLTYVVTRYDRRNFIIEFAIFSPAMVVEKLELALRRTPDGNSEEVHWTRIYTGLSPEGNDWAETYVSQPFQKKMAELAESMNSYLKRKTREDSAQSGAKSCVVSERQRE